MNKIEPKIPDGARVRLRDGIHPEFYGQLGVVGSEGWVRKHETDKFGYQHVYIQWDTDHWAYNGIQNGWTWEDHFEIVEKPMSDEKKPDQTDILARALAKAMREIQDEGKEEEPTPPKSTPKDEDPEVNIEGIAQVFDDLEEDDDKDTLSYAETLEKSMKAAADSEAFILVAARKREIVPGVFALEPVAYHAATDSKASDFCHLQLVHLGGSYVDRLVSDKIERESGVEEHGE